MITIINKIFARKNKTLEEENSEPTRFNSLIINSSDENKIYKLLHRLPPHNRKEIEEKGIKQTQYIFDRNLTEKERGGVNSYLEEHKVSPWGVYSVD